MRGTRRFSLLVFIGLAAHLYNLIGVRAFFACRKAFSLKALRHLPSKELYVFPRRNYKVETMKKKHFCSAVGKHFQFALDS